MLYIILELNSKKARIYDRKIDAIYDHVKFRRKDRVWFLEAANEGALKRLGKKMEGVEVTRMSGTAPVQGGG